MCIAPHMNMHVCNLFDFACTPLYRPDILAAPSELSLMQSLISMLKRSRFTLIRSNKFCAVEPVA